MENVFFSILNWLTDLGYFGIALGLMVEVIPSEIVLAYGGFLVDSGKISFIGAVIAGTIGGVIAQLFLYWLGYYGGRPFLEKYGKFLLIKKSHLDLSEKWFKNYGTGVIFGARFLPVVRHAISIPAGIAKMSVTRFITLTTLAIVPWSILFLYLGMELGSNWKNIEAVAGNYIHYIAIGAVVLFILYFGIHWLIKRKKNNAATK
ncbi:DedA family protein [Shimazuella sp. AN120528]|uniref:DedA family protein n=1 Tax=Shimazuella soli TaxID=1892854 RepID=UPI001F0D5E87|nr:DedA family protein [Shimazuella soli]MCH5586512.1 DedA family protein [Shimazuella soli]